MEKLYAVFLISLVLSHAAAARNIPNDQTKPGASTLTTTSVLARVENVVANADAPAPSSGHVDDEKNFITYGGVGGWAGIGGFSGVIPGLGGIGGASGLGGLGGAGGAGGLGGLGGVGGVGAGGGSAGGNKP